MQRVVLKSASLFQTNLKGCDLSFSDLGESKLLESSLVGTNLSGADISGACLDKANTAGWIIKDIICTHIRKSDGTVIEYAPGEFEKKHTELERVRDIILNMPFSELAVTAGRYMQGITNQAAGPDSGGVLLKGATALDHKNTKLEFVVFDQYEKIAELLRKQQKAINTLIADTKAHIEEHAGPEGIEDLFAIPTSIKFPLIPLDMKPKAIEQEFNKRFASWTPWLQSLAVALQKAVS